MLDWQGWQKRPELLCLPLSLQEIATEIFLQDFSRLQEHSRFRRLLRSLAPTYQTQLVRPEGRKVAPPLPSAPFTINIYSYKFLSCTLGESNKFQYCLHFYSSYFLTSLLISFLTHWFISSVLVFF